MAKEQKTNLYLLSIVAIVAIVGIVVLILNSGAGSVSLSDSDLSGEAYKLTSVKTSSSIDKIAVPSASKTSKAGGCVCQPSGEGGACSCDPVGCGSCN